MIRRVAVTIVLVAVIAAAAILSWCFVLDTSVRRRRAASEVQRISEEARRHPDDPRYAKRLVSIARDQYSFAATYATNAIGHIGVAARPVVGDLVELLDSRNPFVAREAALALGNVGAISEGALPALEQKVREGAPGNEVTGFAALAIGRIGGPARRSLPLLRSKLGSNHFFDSNLREAIELLEGRQAKERKRPTDATPVDDSE